MKTEAKNGKKILIALAVLLVMIAVFFGIYQFTKQTAVTGAKTITVDVIHKDGSLKTFEYHTDC